MEGVFYTDYTELTGESKSGSLAETRRAACSRLRITVERAQEPMIPIALVAYNNTKEMEPKTTNLAFRDNLTGPKSIF